MECQQGTVRWFSNAKGFSFVGTEAGPDVICHHIAIEGEGYRTLKDGETVEFDVEIDPTRSPPGGPRESLTRAQAFLA